MKKILLLLPLLAANLFAADISVAPYSVLVPFATSTLAGGQPDITKSTGVSNSYMIQDSNESGVYEVYAFQLDYTNPLIPVVKTGTRVCVTCGQHNLLFGYSGTAYAVGAPTFLQDSNWFLLSVANPAYVANCNANSRPITPGQGCGNDVFACPISMVSGTITVPNPGGLTSNLCTNITNVPSYQYGILYSQASNAPSPNGLILTAVRQTSGNYLFGLWHFTDTAWTTGSTSPFVLGSMVGGGYQNPTMAGGNSGYLGEASGFFGGFVHPTNPALSTDNGITVVTANMNNQSYWRWSEYAWNYLNPGITIATANYVSGLTATGASGTYCVVSVTNGGGSNGILRAVLTGTNTIAAGAMTVTGTGTGWTSAPTTGTVSNGTATGCTGTPVFTSTITGTTNVFELVPWGAASSADWNEHTHISDAKQQKAVFSSTHGNPAWLAAGAAGGTSPVTGGEIPPLDYWEYRFWYSKDRLGYLVMNTDVETYGYATRLTYFNQAGTADYAWICAYFPATGSGACPNSVSGGDAQLGPGNVYFIGINSPNHITGSGLISIPRVSLVRRQ